jgi:rare lipoprotein A
LVLGVGLLTATIGTQASSNPDRVQPQTENARVGQAVAQKQASAQHHRHLPLIGRASWYGRAFQGKKTANGETYNMYELTAASKTLPLGSYAKVTNLKNHRWVLVRINDRGPMVEGRAIDLSYGAAQALNLTKQGVETVAIQPLPADSEEVAMMEAR